MLKKQLKNVTLIEIDNTIIKQITQNFFIIIKVVL